MVHDSEAARARAQARLEPEGESVAAEAERVLRERTARLRDVRLAKEARERLGAEIRAARRRPGKTKP